MSDPIKEVKRYQTSDGGLHDDIRDAEYHQILVTNTENNTRLLREGKSIGEILSIYSSIGPVEPVLFDVTKDSLLCIPHWQCREEAGYSPLSFNIDGTIFVWGNAGSWSGTYGSNVKVKDLVRYAHDKRSILQAMKDGE